MKHTTRSVRGRRGMVLASVVILGLLLLGLVGGIIRLASQQTKTRVRYEIYKDEFAVAEQALNKAYAQIQYLIAFGTPNFFEEIKNIHPPSVPGYSFPQFKITEVFNGTETVTSGQWTGLTLKRLRYRIDVQAHKEGDVSETNQHPGVALSQSFQITYIPLFMFAIFYDPTMEIAPSPFMQINGMVHCNGDAYFQCDNGLDFMKNVTVAGGVYHGRYAGSGMSLSNGNVRFTGSSGLASMKRNDGDGWLTSLDSDWATMALDTWGGGLKDRAQGVQPLNLPIPTGSDPHAIIERADPANDPYSLQSEKFEYKAGLKIVTDKSGGVSATDGAGNTVDLTYPDPANPKNRKSVASVTTFTDQRENKVVSSVDIDLGRMIEGKIIPANGIVYVTNDNAKTNPGVVRLVNGATVPKAAGTSGLTVATDNPLYIKGDFNTTNKSMAMVAADALYILSNAWNDANSANYSKRAASKTTVNAVCMAGIVPSANSKYSGGVENYFRFLENWSGVDYTFNGSLLDMWKSKQATGSWSGSTTYYSPPRRLWAWDNSLGGMDGPPGAPRVVQLERQAWKTREP